MAVNPCFVLFASLILGVGNFVLGSKMAKLGGVFDSVGFENSAELADLAIFAVQEHNNKEVLSIFSTLSDFVFFSRFDHSLKSVTFGLGRDWNIFCFSSV